jgi:uncharacterized protein
VELRLTFKDALHHDVAAILTTPDGSTNRIAVLCHGFLSSKTSSTNNTLTRILVEKGIATFRFDFFGQGESAGLFEDITVSLAVDQAMAAIDFILTRDYKTIGLVGSSFGGLVSILTTAQRQDIACLALKCPVVDFAEELRLEFGPAEMECWQKTDTIPNILGVSGRVRLKYRLYEDCLRQVAYDPAKIIAIPTLIVQGQKDEMVPLHQSQKLFDLLRGPKRLDLLPEADHQFTRAEDSHAMTTSITQWLIMHLAPPHTS